VYLWCHTHLTVSQPWMKWSPLWRSTSAMLKLYLLIINTPSAIKAIRLGTIKTLCRNIFLSVT